ncbi:hypothetical protein [Evansella cellulosilytica]|uniref:WYL domain-containing protein n=1 Tax=Evansella cellulosilytica (strain ATCC 21833 / DSM 2522 / FERM P-1141 / JCM 9156 / N-4) TaxID=649639 RepID=E6TVC9_EVAC2|nr:hypothetical protein [Evansella cellulosilytica]ADU30946.1 hypothetical protein Bcell_2691 [Evansella cellulosilytica DSM 2522]
MDTLLEKAKSAGKPIIIMYLSKKGLVTKRMVSIDRFDSKWLSGFCHLRKSYRSFHRENILAIMPVTYSGIRKNKIV